MAVSLIRQVRQRAEASGSPLVLIDCPPGTSCSMIAAVRGCDFVLLVTEPTPFGLNDLQLAVETLRLLGMPLGVVINRDGAGERSGGRLLPRRGNSAAGPAAGRPPAGRVVFARHSGLRPAEAVHRTNRRAGKGDTIVRELVVISGKGGSGKTTIAASLASLAAGSAVVADTDVDAADLHLVLRPTRRQSEDFRAGWEPSIDRALCYGCGLCRRLCRFDAIRHHGAEPAEIDLLACEGCGVCADHCPTGAISLAERPCGTLMVSDTPYGPLVHARLLPGAENTGKLVAAVRRRARTIAEQTRRSWISWTVRRGSVVRSSRRSPAPRRP